ncbi:hypothetical protein ACLEJQ_20205 [Pseudomonas sp. SMV71]|uniref:hypothetical protein n=1 Tax=Pseudomonas sp. SMV71 TaxID=3390195 RepID=UPI003F878B07
MDSHSSFTATLRMHEARINLLEHLHGKPAMATIRSFSGGFFTGQPQPHDHSSLLGMYPNARDTDSPPLRLHFRHTADGYILSIKNPGEYYDKLISRSWLEVLGAQHPNTRNPTLFNLVDHRQNIITRKDISSIHSPVSLMTTNRKYVGGLKIPGSPYIYLAKTEEKSRITFILSIH